MKATIQYPIVETKELEVPKELEFWFKKKEEDYTDEEWSILEGGDFDKLLLEGNKIDTTNVDLYHVEILDYED